MKDEAKKLREIEAMTRASSYIDIEDEKDQPKKVKSEQEKFISRIENLDIQEKQRLLAELGAKLK
jgi:hypothetical protein